MTKGQTMTTRNFAILALSGTLLSGCFESERSCYDRLREDFERSRIFANTTCRDVSSRDRCSDYALAAVTSQARISNIFFDDDQNACDYISDGPFLARRR